MCENCRIKDEINQSLKDRIKSYKEHAEFLEEIIRRQITYESSSVGYLNPHMRIVK